MPLKTKIAVSVRAIDEKTKEAWRKGLPQLTREILDDCNQYCKEDAGILIESSHIHTRYDEGKLVWQTPYARRQYWEIRTAYTDVNSNATWKWADVAKTRCKEKWKRQARRLLEMNL